MATSANVALHWTMPSKGQIQAEREAEARRVAARAHLDADVREALAAGIKGDEVAKIVARVMREHGLLASAGEVVAAARSARKK
jgi:hypothetical protein